METSVNITTMRSNSNEKVTKKLSNVNPNASNQNVAAFVVALASLSSNKLINIEKTSKSNLDIPQV